MKKSILLLFTLFIISITTQIYSDLPDYILQSIDDGYNINLELYLNNGGNLEDKDNLGNTLLMLAIKKQQIYLILNLLKNNADVNAINSVGHTPLMHAIKYCPLVVKKLIRNGASIYYKHNTGISIAMWAIQFKRNKLAKKLIDIQTRFYKKEFSILDHLKYAIIHKNIEMVKYLLKNFKINTHSYKQIQELIKDYIKINYKEKEYKSIKKVFSLYRNNGLAPINEESSYSESPILIESHFKNFELEEKLD